MARRLEEGGNRDRGDNVIALDRARQQARDRERAQSRLPAGKHEARARDLVIGGVFVAMALGMLWHWLSPLVGATGLTR